MGFAEQYDLAHDDAFLSRCQVCVVKVAIAISTEGADTPDHEARIRWAQRVVDNPPGWASRSAICVVTNPVITATSTDDDIEFTMISMIGAMSG
jgi:hypothetical protein